MSAKAGPGLRGTRGRRLEPSSPRCLRPHWHARASWDFPKEDTDAPFILSSPITYIHSFIHPFILSPNSLSPSSGAPEVSPVQRGRQSLSQEPAGQALLAGLGGCGRPKAGGKSLPVGALRGLGTVLHKGSPS